MIFVNISTFTPVLIITAYIVKRIEVIYIIYGNKNNTYDDDISTSYDGTFEFNYLNPGDYEIFLYSECFNCAQGQDSLILKPITIENSNDIIEMDTIYIANFI